MLFNWLVDTLHVGENPPHTAMFTSLYLLAALTQVGDAIYSSTLLSLHS